MENIGIVAVFTVILVLFLGILLLIGTTTITIPGIAAAVILLAVILVVGFIAFHIGQEM